MEFVLQDSCFGLGTILTLTPSGWNCIGSMHLKTPLPATLREGCRLVVEKGLDATLDFGESFVATPFLNVALYDPDCAQPLKDIDTKEDGGFVFLKDESIGVIAKKGFQIVWQISTNELEQKIFTCINGSYDETIGVVVSEWWASELTQIKGNQSTWGCDPASNVVVPPNVHRDLQTRHVGKHKNGCAASQICRIVRQSPNKPPCSHACWKRITYLWLHACWKRMTNAKLFTWPWRQ
jgi:hypothetical protein